MISPRLRGWNLPVLISLMGLCFASLPSLFGQEVMTPLADLTSAKGIDLFATKVRYVYLEPSSEIQNQGRPTCKATFYPDCCSGKSSEIRSLYMNGGIAYSNWKPYQGLRLDVWNPQDVAIPLALELHSGESAFSKNFEIPPGKWTTLTLNLGEASKQINLDKVSELRIVQPTDSIRVPNVLYFDQPRLVGADPVQARKARETEDATASTRTPAPAPRFPAAAEVLPLDADPKRTIHINKEVPVAAETDVLVVGGGLAGVAAAVAAARGGAKVLLIERSGALGGMATIGLVPPAMSLNLTGGLTVEMDERLKALGGQTQSRNPEFIKLVLLDMLRDAGAKVLFYTLASDAIMEGNRIKGVIVESKGGAKAILSQVTIDCTGDADIAAYAGAPFDIGRGRDTETQAVTLVFLLADVNTRLALPFLNDRDAVAAAFQQARKDGLLKNAPNAAGLCCAPVVAGEHGAINVNSINVPAVNGLDPSDLTYAHIQCLREIVELTKFFQKYVPGCAECYLVQTGAYLGVRETRRIVGEYVLTGADLISGKTFPDVVACGFYSIDIHTADLTGDAGGARLTRPYDIPYRCLVPKKIDGLLVAGRPISVDHVAHGSTRIMGTTMAIGQAAGVAAALAVKSRIQPREVPPGQIQAALRAAGALPDYMKRVPDNLALKEKGTKVEVDSLLAHSPSPEGAIDGAILEGSLSRWVSAQTPEPHWLILTFARPQNVHRVVLHFWSPETKKESLAYVPTQYQIQYEDRGRWVDVVCERNNQSLNPEYSFEPVSTQRLRLYVTRVRGKDTTVRLREIEVY